MIQPTSPFLGFNRADAVANTASKTALATPPPFTSAESGEHLSSHNSEALQAALKNSPEIRPEVVARGQRLLVDLNYPPRQIIESLSKLFTHSVDLSEQL